MLFMMGMAAGAIIGGGIVVIAACLSNTEEKEPAKPEPTPEAPNPYKGIFESWKIGSIKGQTSTLSKNGAVIKVGYTRPFEYHGLSGHNTLGQQFLDRFSYEELKLLAIEAENHIKANIGKETPDVPPGKPCDKYIVIGNRDHKRNILLNTSSLESALAMNDDRGHFAEFGELIIDTEAGKVVHRFRE